MVLNLEITSFLSLFTQAVSSSQTTLHLSPCHSQGQQNLIIHLGAQGDIDSNAPLKNNYIFKNLTV